MSQYTGSYESDACTGEQCTAAFAVGSSLSQGNQFAGLTKDFHGGKQKKKTRRNRARKMRGGSAPYPNSFDNVLPQELHAAAHVASQDAAFAQLPQFIGSYGSMTGGRRTKKSARKMRGGVAQVDAPAMILSPSEEPAAFLNPQWYTENQVVPSFKGPENSYAVQQYANQFAYNQTAGKRSKRMTRK
jgi:hypothetical protein